MYFSASSYDCAFHVLRGNEKLSMYCYYFCFLSATVLLKINGAFDASSQIVYFKVEYKKSCVIGDKEMEGELVKR